VSFSDSALRRECRMMLHQAVNTTDLLSPCTAATSRSDIPRYGAGARSLRAAPLHQPAAGPLPVGQRGSVCLVAGGYER
jgi:hypothetical protein